MASSLFRNLPPSRPNNPLQMIAEFKKEQYQTHSIEKQEWLDQIEEWKKQRVIPEIQSDRLHAHTVLDERNAVAVEDVSANGGDADRHAGAGGNLCLVFRALGDLDIPEPGHKARKCQEHHEANE